jgi:hypothetical protein
VLTQTHNRILTPALAAASDPVAGFPELHKAVSSVVTVIDRYAARGGLTA